MEAKIQCWGTGRRKESVARVRIVPAGKGRFIINDRALEEYFPLKTLQIIVTEPLRATDNVGKVDVLVNVYGGGSTGQAGAIRHGLARALVRLDEKTRPVLKKVGFLTRDSRMKERKKYGLKKARKAPQFSKR